MKKNKHCCELLNNALENIAVPFHYSERYREYRIVLRGGSVVKILFYCPWCGVEFPRNLQDEYFETLKDEYSLDVGISAKDSDLPSDFRDETWWRKRGL